MGGSAKKGGRKLSAFNIFMKQELKRLKSASPGMDHKKAFKQAAQNWSSKKSSFKVPSKGMHSKTRKGRKDFETHKGDKVFHRKKHFVRKSRKPYTKKAKKSKK